MGLDIFFREDIANILEATAQAASAVGAYSDDARAVAFQAGWNACLATLATAFNIEWAPLPKVEVVVIEHPRRALVEDNGEEKAQEA